MERRKNYSIGQFIEVVAKHDDRSINSYQKMLLQLYASDAQLNRFSVEHNAKREEDEILDSAMLVYLWGVFIRR